MSPRSIVRLRNAGVTVICVGVLAVILIVLRQTPLLGLFSKSLRRNTSIPVEPEVAGIVILCGAGVVVLGIVMVVAAAVLRARAAQAGAGPEAEAGQGEPDAGPEQGKREDQPVGDQG
ncbi:hypothetical protein AB0J63_46970 [Streptosporangium canum]|uniref:hypothetical protein n=1 Tax=Streptosporangium canum TaxID=324952 RepID=UPI00341A81F5